MRKRKLGRKLSRKKDQRKALLKGLASTLILNEKIRTTEAKAKEVRPLVEKFITQAQKEDLSSRRLLARFFSPKIVTKLLKEIGPRYKERKGGYTRIIKLGPRKTDGARMAIIELIKG
ncbi:MAG: 50S ribosomal protein L17 [Candidatus Pacebacteria bacterium]|nr:50S ribosomal protein L17 [Candidatus Paceibacterota bacterium]